MVGEESERPPFQHVAKMTNASESCEQLSVKGWPLLLIALQAHAEKAERFPASGTPLLQYASDRHFGGIRS